MKKLHFFLLVKIITVVLFNYGFAAITAAPATTTPAAAAPVAAPLAAAIVKAIVATGPVAPVATSGSQLAATQALAKAQQATMPLFSTTPAGESKLSCFTLFFSLINTKTPKVTVGLGVESYIKLVLHPVLESTALTSQQLTDTLSMLTTVLAQVATIEPATDKPPLSKLTPYKDKLTARSALVAKISAELDTATALPNDQLDKKIAAYTALLSKVDSSMLDSARQAIINAINSLYAVAKKGAPAQRAAMQKMVPIVAVNNSFTQVEKHNLTTTLIGGTVAPVATLTPATTGGAADNPALATAFKNITVDANKQPVPVTAQCQIAQNALPLITATSSAADKNLFITLANGLCVAYFTMNSEEIGFVEAFCTAVLNNTYIVPTQNAALREILQAWIKKLKTVKKVAEPTVPLLKTLKNFAEVAPFDLVKCLKLLDIGISLLAGEGNVKLPAAEVDQKSTTSLVVVMRNLLGTAYAKRSSEYPPLMIQLAQLMTSKNAASLNILPAWVDNITFLNKVLAYQALVNTKALEAIQNILALVKSLATPVPPATAVPVIDSFGIGVLVNTMTNLYGTRATRAQLELVALQNLCAECGLDAYKKIFNATQRTIFARWGSALGLLNELSNAESETKLATCLTLLKKIITSLVEPANADLGDERARFIAVLQKLFNRRGILTTDDLGRLGNFFKSIQANPALMALLSSSQKEFVSSSIADSATLFAQVSGGSSGAAILDRLLERQDNIDALKQVLVLMVDSITGTEARIGQLVKRLNALVSKYESLDRAALIALLRSAATKKTTNGLLLADKQITAINAAVGRLQRAG